MGRGSGKAAFRSRRGSPNASKLSDGGRSRLQVYERRQQLLELGVELFSRRNAEDIAIDEIARAAGISKGLLYHYFGSKRDYYVESVRFAAQQIIDDIDAVAGDFEGDSRGRLRAGLDIYLSHVAKRARGYAMLVTSGASDAEVHRVVENVRRVFKDRILSSLGIAPPHPRVRAALTGWIGFVEAASLDWLEHRDVDPQEIRELLVAVLLGALRGAGLSVSPTPDSTLEVET